MRVRDLPVRMDSHYALFAFWHKARRTVTVVLVEVRTVVYSYTVTQEYTPNIFDCNLKINLLLSDFNTFWYEYF